MSTSPESLVGRTLDGRYRIETVSARGGMATVFIASDLRLRRVVALKVMHASLADDPNFVARFEREARAAAALTHQHVVAVHDQGRDAATGAVYLVMELVSGHTIRDVLAERTRLSTTQALAVMDPVLQALSAAHAAGFVHRDVKPENVMISDDGRIKVTDFGLARAIENDESTATTRGVLIGTVAYLSPEQVERGVTDARSDVYSAGILLFEMVTGKVPHAGDTPIAVAFQHVHADIPLPSTLNPAIPAVFDRIVRKATQRNPELRYQSADEFLADVRTARDMIDGSVPLTPAASAQTSTTAAVPSTPAELPTTVIARNQPASPAAEVRNDDIDPPDDHYVTGVHATQITQRPRRQGREKSIKPRRQWKRWVALAILIAGFGVWFNYTSNQVRVPQLIGKSLAQAKSDLTRVELTAEVTKRVFSDTVPENVVISANPASGDSASKGSAVNLTISRGPEKFAVPSVSGQSVTQATSAITRANLAVSGTESKFHPTVAQGSVISTEPKAGSKLDRGSNVTLVISRGPEPVAIPDIKGLKLKVALAALSDAGFTTIVQERVNSDTVKRFEIIKVEPKIGKRVQLDTSITIFVSLGPPPVAVPNVVGLSQTAAEKLLTESGLTWRIDSQNSCKTGFKVSKSTVQQQSVVANSTVPKNSVIGLGIYNFCVKR